MLRLIACVAVAALLALPAMAAEKVTLRGADFVACRAAADQPICLLKLVARSRFHTSYRDNIKIGYAPAVLAAIGPDPADDPADLGVLRLPWKAPAALALIADKAGADPRVALAPIRAIAPRIAARPAEQPKMDAYAASERIHAYEIVWNAGHGDDALPSRSRPSQALSHAALEAWRAELPLAGEEGDASSLADIYRKLGDAATADAFAPLTPQDRVAQMIEVGRYEEAAALLDQLQSEPMGALTAEGRMEAAMGQFFFSGSRGEIIRKAVAGGHTDLGLRLAEADLRRWLDGPASGAKPTSAADGAAALQIAQDLVLIAEKAPRPAALKLVERMDAAGRNKAASAAPFSAMAAMRAWTALGQPARAQALLSFWSEGEDAGKTCRLAGLTDFKRCAEHPAMLIPMAIKSQPLDTPWDELAPGSDDWETKTAAAGPSGLDAQLAKLQSPKARVSLLSRCGREMAIRGAMQLAAHCARRIAAEPADAFPHAPLVTALHVAAKSALGDDEAMRTEMLGLAFDLAARDPSGDIEASDLEDIAVGELRAQGRL